MNRLTADHLGVCTWSLQPQGPDDLVGKVKATGLRKAQLALTAIADAPDAWADVFDALRDAGVTVISGMISPYAEDYTTLETIRRTGGVVPDATWEKNLAMCRRVAQLAQREGVETLTFHAGFIPHDPASAGFATVTERLGKITDLCAEHGQQLLLETGQETAEDLLTLLDTLGRENLGVNFDPANMILYGQGDPVAALEMLMPRIGQVHLKDATPAPEPGQWGVEVPLGTGSVDWDAFLSVLSQHRYAGNLVIEREAGNDRLGDIRAATAFITERLNP